MTVLTREDSTFDGLLLPGETPREGLHRLERTVPAQRFSGMLETDVGQRLLAAAALQARASRRAVLLEPTGLPPTSSHTEDMLLQGYSGLRGGS